MSLIGKNTGRMILLGAGVSLFVAAYIYFMQLSAPPPEKLQSTDSVIAYQLHNGMKVLVKEDDRAAVVVSQVWYKVGSSYEPAGKTGMSHVLEHMMFKGTSNYEAGEFSEIIALNGGRENAFTSKDYTAYFQRIASDRLELCLELEADRMRNLVLDEAEFKKEIEVVKEERRLRTEDSPTAKTYERFNAEAFTTGSYHHPIIGWMEDLDNMTVQDLRGWYNQWYAPNNATLVVSGDVKAEQVVQLANKYFGSIEPREIPALQDKPEAAQDKQRSITVELPAQIPYLMMGYKVPSLLQAADEHTRSEVFALEVLAGVLDGGSSARLTSRLMRGQQIASSVGVGYNLYDRLNTLFMFTGLPANGSNVAGLKQALLNEIENLKTTPVELAELNRVKAQVIASNIYEKDSMFYQAMQLGILETVGLGWEKKDEYVNEVNKVTAAQIQAVAKKYFVADQLTVAELKPLPMKNTSAQPRAISGGRHAR